MSYASIVEVYGKDFGAAEPLNYPMTELLGRPQSQLPGHTHNEDPLATNNINVQPPVHTRVNTRHHAPAQPAPSTHAEPGKYPGYLTKGLPPTQYKALEDYTVSQDVAASSHGPSHLNNNHHLKEFGGSQYAQHPMYNGELPCDLDNYPCEAYLTHFKHCAQCRQKALFVLKKKDGGIVEGFANLLGGGNGDTSDLIMFGIIGLVLYYLLFRGKK
jgi:hypothetical protein